MAEAISCPCSDLICRILSAVNFPSRKRAELEIHRNQVDRSYISLYGHSLAFYLSNFAFYILTPAVIIKVIIGLL